MPTSRRTPLPPRAADPQLLPHHGPTPALAAVHRAIVSCERCPRLRRYCQRIAMEKRAAFRDQVYWGRPVPGFGDPAARLLIVGLAPAAHGANRTGRVFTGDGIGGSSDFLLAAMHASGFANKPVSRHVGDGLELRDAFIAAAVRCAPPDNKPTPEEFGRCQTAPAVRVGRAAQRHRRALPRQAGLGRLLARAGRARPSGASPAPGLRARRARAARRRVCRAGRLSPQPSEHAHRASDAEMLGRCVREGA